MNRLIAVTGEAVRVGGALALFVALAAVAQPVPSGKVAAPAPAGTGIPPIELLLKNFPTGSDEEVRKRIGGKVDEPWITNTSAVRLSRAFNLSGAPIPAANTNAGMRTLKGADKLNYAYSAAEFRTWLTSKYGQPTLSLKSGPYGTAPQALKGRRGIILFHDVGWSDASGHMDLWDGQKVAGKEYFALAKQIHLWEPKATTTAAAAKTGILTATTNVRSGPSSSAAIVGNLERGTVVTITGAVTNNFYNIGNNRYVSANYVKLQ